MAIEVYRLEYDPHTNMVTDDVGDIDYKNIIEMIGERRLESLKSFGGMEVIKDVEPGVWYQIEFPIPDDLDIVTLYYDPDQNLFEDEFGFVMYNIFAFISPTELMMFKDAGEDMRFHGLNRRTVELIYRLDSDEEAS